MKKMKGSAILLLLLLCSQIFGAVCGDVNIDSQVDIVDALLIARAYVGGSIISQAAGDVNSDAEVNIVDALLIAQVYVGAIDALPGCTASMPGSGVDTPKKCMFIGASPSGSKKIRENAGYDKHIIALLEEWGYVIDKKHSCSAVLTYTAADFEPYDFIFLSESIHTSQIQETLRSIHKPMLCAEAMGTRYTKLGFADSDKNTGGLYHPGRTTQILSTVGDHPLAAGFAPGTDINFGDFSSKNSCLMTWGAPTINVIPIAAMKNNPKQLVAYGIEKGTINAYGDTINHRVSVVGTHAWCYRARYIGEPMKKLIQAGINWILKNEVVLPVAPVVE